MSNTTIRLPAKTAPNYIVFISANVKNYDTLLNNLSSDVEVYLLDAKQDGVLQMATILQERSGLDAIHIISNGNSGELSLGATILNSDNLSFYADALARIGSSLSVTGDILLYGCNVAQGSTGVHFINSLTQYTGADVGASNDFTGNAALGGDWVLEASTGALEASSLAIDGYAGLLNDIPTVILSSTFPSMREGDIGSKLMTFTAVLSTAATSDVTVNYATSNGSALAGTDYTATSGTLTFAAGETSKTFTVEVLGDTVYENNENFSVNLSNPSGALLGNNGSASAIATIINDDLSPLPTVTLSSTFPSITEGNIGSKLMTFTAVLSTAAPTAVTIDYATSNGSAIAGSDYKATSGTLTFAAGETSKTFTVEMLGDTVYENNENFSVNLSNPSGALLGNNGSASAIATIINDDLPTVTLSPTFPSITEGNIGSKLITFTATLSAAATTEVTVNYATSNGSALAGSDYTATSSILTFAAGETSKTFTVEVLSDTVYENNENFLVNLSNPSGAVLGNNGSASAIATITNDDVSTLPTVTLSPTFPSITEGDIGSQLMTFTATLSTSATSEVSVDYATSNGSAIAGGDYIATSGILTFAAGETSKTFTVEVLGDTVYENNENFSVNLSNPSGALLGNNGSASAIATITDDDVSTLPTVVLSPMMEEDIGSKLMTFTAEFSMAAPTNGLLSLPTVTLSSMMEGDIGSKLMTFTAVLSTAATSEVTVNYATSNGSALAGSDYMATSGTLTFAAGETSKTFTVEVLGDTVYENNEDFSVNLSNPSGAVLGNNGSASAIATITNDDIPPLPIVTLSPTFPSITEGNIGSKLITFTATLSTAATSLVTIDYATSNDSALAGSDYTATSGTLTFAVGETSKTFTVEVLSDTVYENNESFSVDLSNPSGAVLGNNGSACAIATIINDDISPLPIVTLSPTFPSITEGDIGSKLMTFTAALSTVATSAVTIDYATSNGSALAGSDYTATSGILTFAAGETSKTFTVEVMGDTVYENNENFSVNLSNPSGAVLGNNGSACAIATVINDDVSTLPTVILSPTFTDLFGY